MAEFTYQAMAATGQRSAGKLTANTEREALALLDAKGLFPLQIEPVKSASSGRRGLFGVGGRTMATFYSQLADLLRAGVPLLRALDILERMGGHQTLQAALRDIRAKVADGTGLAQAMGQHPNVFSELAVSMVRAGQEGGFLEDVLKRVADFTEHQEDLKSKVFGALAYPVFLFIVGFLVLLGLFLFVIPKFEVIFKKLEEKGELPTISVVIMGVSNFLLGNWWWIIFIVVGIVSAVVYWMRTPSGRYRTDLIKIKLPGAGRVFQSLGLSRFTRILGTLLTNGIPILRSLDIAKDSTGNRVLTEAIEKSAENITAGQKLAEPLGACPYFPRDVVEMIAIAEESNNLENVLIEIALSLEKRTARQLEMFVRLLEPAMLLVMAVIVGVVVAGLLFPIFKMGSAVG